MQEREVQIECLRLAILFRCLMFVMWQQEVKAHDAEMENMRATLEDQSMATVEALNNNTRVLTRIMERLAMSDDDKR